MRDMLALQKMRPALLLVLVIGFVVALQVTPVFAAGTITVTTTTDEFVTGGTSTGCSLREAVSVANNDSNAAFPECAFTGTLDNDTIIFGSGGTGTHNLSAGQLVFLDTDGTTIDGGSIGTVTINSSNTNRVILVGNDASADNIGRTLTLNNLIITGGDAVGNVGGSATVRDGGCIYVATNSTLNMDTAVVRNCTATTGDSIGGGIFAAGAFGGSSGTTVNLDNVTIRNNRAANGAGIGMRTGIMTITNGSCIRNNEAVGGTTSFGFGGGIYLEKDTLLDIDASSVIGNSARGAGAGIFHLVDSSFQGDGIFLYDNRITFNGLQAGPINTTGAGSAWFSQGGDTGFNGPGRRCTNCCIVGNSGVYAVHQNVNTLVADWTSNWWGDNWGPLVYDIDPAQASSTNSGSNVSNGDGIYWDPVFGSVSPGYDPILIDLTDDGTWDLRPQGDWLLSASAPTDGFPPAELPITTTAPAACEAVYCTGVSSQGQSRSCNNPTSCGLLN